MENENRNQERDNEVCIRCGWPVILALAVVLLIPASICWFLDIKYILILVVPLIIGLTFYYGKSYHFTRNGVFVYTLLGYQQRRMSWYQITRLERFCISMQTYLIVSTMDKPLPKLVMQDYILANSNRLLQVPVPNKFFESDDYKKIVAMMEAAHNE